jgi:hypothetical protein
VDVQGRPGRCAVGELSETDLTRYLGERTPAIRDMAAIAQLPAQSLGIDGSIKNISAEALAGLEDGEGPQVGRDHRQSRRVVAADAAARRARRG